MAEPVPASVEPLNTLSRRLLNIHALVLSQSELVPTSGYVQLNNYLADWEKSFLPASDCTQAVQNNKGAEGNADGEPGIEPWSEDTRPKAKVNNAPSEAEPIVEGVSQGPFVFLMSDHDLRNEKLYVKGQPKYIRVPELLLRTHSPVLALLLDLKPTWTDYDLKDRFVHDPNNTQYPRKYIKKDKIIHMQAVVNLSFGDHADRTEIWKMPNEQQWRAVYNWAYYLNSGRVGERTFKNPITPSLRDDLKVLAAFLGCGENFVEAVEKACQDEKESKLFIKKKKPRARK